MASFLAIVGALLCLSLTAGNPFPPPCPSGDAWGSGSDFGSDFWGSSSGAAAGSGYSPIIEQAPQAVSTFGTLAPRILEHDFGSGSWNSGSRSKVTSWGSSSSSGVGSRSFGSSSGVGSQGFGSAAGAGSGYSPIIIEQTRPAPVTFGSFMPSILEHESAPYQINYFGTPYVIRHKQSASLTVHTQTPVVVDTFAEPQIEEHEAAPAFIVKEVCPASQQPETPCH